MTIQFVSTGAQFDGGLMRVEALEINKARADPAGGALRMEGAQAGVSLPLIAYCATALALLWG